MLSLIALMCSYRLFIYLSQCAEEEQLQLAYYDSAIDMDDSNMSDTHSQDISENSENTDLNNLIVNYLPEQTTQSDLQEMFQGFGDIESCRLIRHKHLGHSLGYGFVKYFHHKDALTAIERMNGLTLHSKSLKVSFARPATDPIKTANLYVSGLRNTINESQLTCLFNPYGKVLSVKVMHNDNDSAKTSAIGFVRFEKQADAQKALEELNGKVPPGNPAPLHVSFAKQSKDSMPPAAILAATQASYAPPFQATTRFANFGKTPSMVGGRNMRFDPMGRSAMHRPIVTEYGHDGYTDPSGGTGHVLFVFNLAPEVEELHLWRLFGPYGAIRSVNIIQDKSTSRSKGYAFITMPNYDEAENAILVLNQSVVEGKIIHVSFKKPGKKGMVMN